jgi:hypothetical protein
MNTRAAPAFSLAFGGVLLAMAVYAVEVRMDEPWAEGVLLLVATAGAVALFGLARAAPSTDDPPAAAASALLLAGVAVSGIAIYRLGHILRDADPTDASGTLTWSFAALSAVALTAAARTRSAACLLAGAVAAAGTILAAVSWVFDTDNPATFRGVLGGLVVVFAAAAALARGRHREVLVDAAGLALLGISFLASGDSFIFLGGSLPDAWEAVLLAGALGLAGFSVATRAPGPAVLALLVSVAFVTSVVAAGSGSFTPADEFSHRHPQTLVGWPLILLIAAAASVAYGVARSRR